jgi:hypothetical protein
MSRRARAVRMDRGRRPAPGCACEQGAIPGAATAGCQPDPACLLGGPQHGV